MKYCMNCGEKNYKKICSACNMKNRTEQNYCGWCGTKIEENMDCCSNCKIKIKEGYETVIYWLLIAGIIIVYLFLFMKYFPDSENAYYMVGASAIFCLPIFGKIIRQIAYPRKWIAYLLSTIRFMIIMVMFFVAGNNVNLDQNGLFKFQEQEVLEDLPYQLETETIIIEFPK